jgi:hypothetical protein
MDDLQQMIIEAFVGHDVSGLRESNARCQPPLEAGATQERTLEAVGCTPLFGAI